MSTTPSSWYIRGEGGQPTGPFTAEQLVQSLQVGRLDRNNICWREGMPQWLPMGEVEPFATALRRAAQRSAACGAPHPAGTPAMPAGIPPARYRPSMLTARYFPAIAGCTAAVAVFLMVLVGAALMRGKEAGDTPSRRGTPATGREEGPLAGMVGAARTAARRAQSTTKLKMLGLAMHNYHDSFGRFPARAIFDDDGRPLLSWRVLMLPYVDEGQLFDAFRRDEPWDSEHNRKLIEHMPDVFRSPSSRVGPGKTVYLAPVGEGMMFNGSKGKRFSEIHDGTSSTIMLLEVNDSEAVVWTRPDDWKFDPRRPMAGLGSSHVDGFNAAFADGSVRFLADSLDPDVFKAWLTTSGGELVRFEP